MIPRLFPGALLGLGLLLTLTGVSPAAATPPAPTPSPERLTLVLDWFVNPDHGPLVIAREKGFFKAVGLDVELIAPSDPNDPPKLVAAGQADVAVSYQPQLLIHAAAGLPLTRIATLVDTPLNALVVLKDGPVKTLADLKGRKVGYSVSGFEDALLGTMLEHAGLALSDVTLVNVNFSLSPSLLTGQVDAVVGAFRNFELNQMALENHPGQAFFPEEAGVPPYDELILVARRDRAGEARLGRLVGAIEQATLWLLNHPEEGWSLFAATGKELGDALNRRAWADTLPRFAHAPAALDGERYRRFGEYLKARGVIAQVPALADIAAAPARP